jgi:hypothetical protein
MDLSMTTTEERIAWLEQRLRETAGELVQANDRIEALEAALLPAKNTLNAVRILMKNRDRREHEQQVYEAVQICCEAMEDVFTPEQDK